MGQQEEIARVGKKISHLVVTFCQKRRLFRAEELRDYVRSIAPEIAPDSPGRILRDLRLRGRLKYTVLSRSGSLYQVDAVPK